MTAISISGGRYLHRPPPQMDFSEQASMKQFGGTMSSPHHRHMWVITGPAGCGKSSIARYLAEELSLPYIEGDDYHPQSNKDKMSNDIPLTDEDRWDWLITLRNAAVTRLTPSSSGRSATRPHDGVVVACSALKHKYRDVIRIAAYNDHRVLVHFIYLHVDEETLLRRVGARKGHFMKSTMVRSQMEMLEEPGADEQRDVLEVDCSPAITEVQRTVLRTVREALADDRQ